MELLDIYDADGRALGTKPRDAVHRDGDWHRCFHLWVVRREGVLFQRRAPDKHGFPDMLDATAAGHLLAGESVPDGLREVEEELGATWPLEDLTDLGVHRVEDHPTPDTTNREFQHVFAIRDERALEEWTGFDRVELAGLVLVTHEGYALLASGAPGAVTAKEWDGTRVHERLVDTSEVVPAPYLEAIGPPLRALSVDTKT